MSIDMVTHSHENKHPYFLGNALPADIAVQLPLFRRGHKPCYVVKQSKQGQCPQKRGPASKQIGGDSASYTSNPFDCCLRHFHSPFDSSLDSLFCCWRYC